MNITKWKNDIKTHLEVKTISKAQTTKWNNQAQSELEDLVQEEAYMYCCELDSPNSPDFQRFLEHIENQLLDHYQGLSPHPFHKG